MRDLKQSTARNLSVFMSDSTDHITGKTGLTLVITASKDGAAFASITPTVTELGSGWYSLALTTTHTNTLGDLALHITATGADPTDVLAQVVPDLSGGSSMLPLAGIRKNTAVPGFQFTMFNSDGTAGINLTVTGKVSLDGGAFVNLTNAPVEIGNGWYKVDLANADVNGKTVALKFNGGTGVQETDLTLVTDT